MSMEHQSARRKRVVVLGLDAVTPQLLEPWMAEGKLPHLAQVAADGAYGRLSSTMPPASPLAWSTFLTGVNPGKHGIFAFARRRDGSYHQSPVNARDFLSPTVASLLSAAGLSLGHLFVPLTYPPQKVNGFVVSGMGTPGLKASFTYPSELKDELLAAFRPEQITEPTPEGKSPIEYLASLERSIADKTEIMHWILDRFPHLDLFQTVFIEADRMQHFAWHYMDPEAMGHDPDAPPALRNAIDNCYRRLDDVVGSLRGRLDRDTALIILSDHGAGPYDQFIDLNRWLEREGFLTFASGNVAANHDLFSKLYSVWRRGPRRLFSASQLRSLRRRLPISLVESLSVQSRNSVLTRIDWSRTRAFSEGADGLISINQLGREPEGIVAPGKERQQLIREIAHRLEALRDPHNGNYVVSRVWHREELYSGPGLHRAADLVVEWHEQRYHSLAIWNDSDEIFYDPGRWWGSSHLAHSGHHLRDGVVLACGPGVPARTSFENANIADVPATIVHLLGLPVPPSFDGQVMPSISGERLPWSEDSSLSAKSVDQDGNAYSQEDEAAVEEMLRGLGYLG